MTNLIMKNPIMTNPITPNPIVMANILNNFFGFEKLFQVKDLIHAQQY